MAAQTGVESMMMLAITNGTVIDGSCYLSVAP